MVTVVHRGVGGGVLFLKLRTPKPLNLIFEVCPFASDIDEEVRLDRPPPPIIPPLLFSTTTTTIQHDSHFNLSPTLLSIILPDPLFRRCTLTLLFDPMGGKCTFWFCLMYYKRVLYIYLVFNENLWLL